MNEFNDLIYEWLSFTTIDIDGSKKGNKKENNNKQKKPDMIVTSSQFDPAHYGNDFVRYFANRAGLKLDPDKEIPVSFIISTTQNPWLTSTSQGNFLNTLMDVLKKTANEAAKTVMKNHNIPLPVCSK